MISVTGPLWLWSGEGGNWHFLTVPKEKSSELRAAALARRRGFGSVPVEVSARGVTWRTSVFPQKDGSYLLPVKAEVRKKVGVAAGDELKVSLRLV